MNRSRGESSTFSTSPPLVSAVIAVYNAERFIDEALDSVESQTFDSIEIVVVDDGSTDGSGALLKRRSGVRVITQSNRGPGAARNVGIRAAGGDLIALLDADDVWRPEKTATQVEAFLQDPELELAFCRVDEIVDPLMPAGGGLKLRAPWQGAVGTIASATMVKRAAFEKVGDFLEGPTLGEWFDWWTRAVDIGINRELLPQTLVDRRLHDGNRSLVDPDGRVEMARALKHSLDRRRSGTVL